MAEVIRGSRSAVAPHLLTPYSPPQLNTHTCTHTLPPILLPPPPPLDLPCVHQLGVQAGSGDAGTVQQQKWPPGGLRAPQGAGAGASLGGALPPRHQQQRLAPRRGVVACQHCGGRGGGRVSASARSRSLRQKQQWHCWPESRACDPGGAPASSCRHGTAAGVRREHPDQVRQLGGS